MNRLFYHHQLITITALLLCILTFCGCDMVGRALGISNTPEPTEPLAWSYTDGKVELNLLRTPELSLPGSAVRLAERGLPKRVLLVYANDGKYYAFRNRCPRDNRHIDHVAGDSKVQCCGLGKSDWNYQGELISGPAIDPLEAFPVDVLGNKVVVIVGG